MFIFWDVFQASFFVELQDHFFMDVDCMLTLFFGILLHLTAPLVLVICFLPFLSKIRFPKTRGHQTELMFNMFCRLRFKYRFSSGFLRCLICGSISTIFQENTVPKITSTIVGSG